MIRYCTVWRMFLHQPVLTPNLLHSTGVIHMDALSGIGSVFR